MSKKDLTEIVAIIDRSGSMASIVDDAIGGLNTFLEEQKKVPGEALITLVLYDDEYILHWDGIDLQAATSFNRTTYVPRGTTALLDAIGKTILTVGERLSNTSEESRPEKIMVVILTDGMENASKEFNHKQIMDMVKLQKDTYQWEFLYLAANQDAIQTGGRIGIDPGQTANFAATPKGVTSAFASMSRRATSFRNEV